MTLKSIHEEVTRITLVTEDGVEFERYDMYPDGVEVHLQDDGRTLKIFPRKSFFWGERP